MSLKFHHCIKSISKFSFFPSINSFLLGRSCPRLLPTTITCLDVAWKLRSHFERIRFMSSKIIVIHLKEISFIKKINPFSTHVWYYILKTIWQNLGVILDLFGALLINVYPFPWTSRSVCRKESISSVLRYDLTSQHARFHLLNDPDLHCHAHLSFQALLSAALLSLSKENG